MVREIMGLSVEYEQEGNTLGTTSKYEFIKIRAEYQLPGEGPFFVISTDGWSFDSEEELTLLIDRVKRAEEVLRGE